MRSLSCPARRFAGTLLVALCVAGAAQIGASSTTSAPSDPAAAAPSFGQWVVATFPTAEAGFARHPPATGS